MTIFQKLSNLLSDVNKKSPQGVITLRADDLAGISCPPCISA
jgi:hypothetical protein